MIAIGYDEKELKQALLEIIDALICISEHGNSNCNRILKRSLHRFCEINRQGFMFPNSAPYVRLGARKKIGFICTYSPKFHASWDSYAQLIQEMEEAQNLSPEEQERLPEEDAKCAEELEESLETMPIEDCEDYNRLVEAFSVMRHLIHFALGLDGWTQPKSLLIDYVWAPKTNELREKAQKVFDRLESREIDSIQKLRELRREVRSW